MTDNKKNLEKENISNLLLRLSVPAIIGMMIQATYNITDTIFVGRALGENGVYAIGGLAVAFPVQMIIMATALAIGIGGASLISRSIGKNDLDRAERTFGNVILLVFISSIGIIVFGTIYLSPILQAFGATDTILPYSYDYLQIILYGTFFFSFALAVNSIVRAEGNANIAMYSMIISAGLNILLDPLFIFGLGMGIRGAAYATVISQFICALYLIHYYLNGKSIIKFRLKNLKPDFRIINEISAIGISPFVRQGSSSIVVIVLNNVLVIYGGDVSVAVFGIMSRLLMFTIMPVMGIVHGVQPIIGFNYGAKNYDRVIQSVKLSAFVASGISFAGFLLLFLFPEQLMNIFTSDKMLIEEGISAIRISVLALPFVGFQIIGSALYQSIGKARPSFILSMSRQVFFLIPLVIILPRFFELNGVWIAFPISDLLAFALTFTMVSRELKSLNIEEV